MRICSICEDEFELTPDKPGFVDHCLACSIDGVERLGGNSIWTHKTAPELEIKPLGEAQAFAKLQRRFGAGPLKSITQQRESPENPGSKNKTGAESRAVYYSKSGEKRSVKP